MHTTTKNKIRVMKNNYSTVANNKMTKLEDILNLPTQEVYKEAC